MLSRRSVATPAVRFGHAIHRPPARTASRASVSKRRSSSGEPRREEQHDIVLAARLMTQPRAVGHRLERALEALGRAHERDARAGLDTELLG